MLASFIAQLDAHTAGDASFVLLLAKSTIILVAALCVTLAMRRASAGSRHLVWLVTVGTLLLVPALTAWSPLRVELLPALASVTDVAPDVTMRTRSILQRDARADAPAFARDVDVPAGVVNDGAESPQGIVVTVRRMDALSLSLLVWSAIALVIFVSLSYATLVLRRLVRASRPLNDEAWLSALYDACDRLGLDSAPRLLESSETKMPFACGVLRPTIVLPVESDGWTLDRRRAVLLHELAHVRRHDLVGHTLARVACAVYWFHPLVWMAAKRLRSESERACDDMALECGTSAADYAEHLLDIVTSVRGDSTPQVALAMARRKDFEGRMLAILDPDLDRMAPSRWKSGALVASLCVLAVGVGAAAPVRQAPRLDARGLAATREAVPVRDDALVGGADVAATSRAASVASISAPAGIAEPAGPGDSPALLARVLATDTDAKLRRIAAWGLAKYPTSAIAAPALITALQHDASAEVRETAAWALARIEETSAAESDALATALRRDSDASVRATSAWALGRVGNATSAPALIAALSDADADVRARAVWALGTVRPETAPRPLLARLSDSDADVRHVAAWALSTIRDPAAIPALQAALRRESDRDLQVAYVRAIGAMGDSAVDALRSVLESTDPRVKSIAVQSLANGQAAGPWPWPWPDPRPFP